MQALCDTLLGEYRALCQLCDTLTEAQWQARTHFHRWTPWDEIAHLAYFDETALQSVNDPVAFETGRDALNAAMQRGEEISVLARQRYGHLNGPQLLAHWRGLHEALVTALRPLDAKARLAWYGPTMSARSFATARLMETWAHGQDIWDALGRTRPAGPGLQAICHLGVTTYGWTFVNRGLPAPEPAPHVTLTGPAGQAWTWGEPSNTDVVQGPATDFALLVTQRRHRDDTALRWVGRGAEAWTRIAQCFAGPPADGPAAGERLRPPSA